MKKILAINPGSTSTKFAIYEGKTAIFEHTLRHEAQEIAKYSRVIEQLAWRKSLIIEGLKQYDVELSDIEAVVGRGGLTHPIQGGIYAVNDELYADTRDSKQEHASNLGALLAREIAQECGKGVGSYIADPVVVDELSEVARISGHPLFPRRSAFHALNSRAIARHHATDSGSRYEDMSLIVVHMGGGVSVSVHDKGRIVDVTNALSGDGSFSPERAGRIEPMALVDACYSGKYSQKQMQKMLVGEGGLVAHLGCNSMYQVVMAALDGVEESRLIVEAFCYNVSKDVGAMATTLSGKVDGILITGGIAFNDTITGMLKKRLDWIAPVTVYPGEDELGALVSSVVGVLKGEITPKVYVS